MGIPKKEKEESCQVATRQLTQGKLQGRKKEKKEKKEVKVEKNG